MMMQPAMVNPYASAVKTAEIMSRYRPIAPKPMDGGAVEVQGGDGCGGGSGGGTVDVMSEKIRQSPYLRNLWPKLQARPTRTRKRGRMIGVSVTPSAFKRTSPPQGVAARGAAAACLGLAPPLQYYAVKSVWFGHGFVANGAVEGAVSAPSAAAERLVTLPLLPSARASSSSPDRSKAIDLNSMMEATLEEMDLTLQLRGPAESSACSGGVISPRPIRPVGSCITVHSVNSVNGVNAYTHTSLTSFNGVNAAKIFATLKNPNEVEAEIEAEALPAVVTDSKNRVRLTNSAYNEMVGQPECMWLGSMGGGGGRIGGEVVIKTAAAVSAAADCLNGGFKAQVRIEWGIGGGRRRKAAVDACCDVERLRCASKEYIFAWRFRTAAEP